MADYPIYAPLSPQPSGGGAGGGRPLLIAGLVMALGMFALPYFMPTPAPAPAPAPGGGPAAPAPEGGLLPAPGAGSSAAPVPEEEIPLLGGDLSAVAGSGGAGLTWATCLKNPAGAVQGDSGVLRAFPNIPPLLALEAEGLDARQAWRVEVREPRAVTFATELPNGIRLRKRIELPERGYRIGMRLTAENPGSSPVTLKPTLLLPGPTPEDDPAAHAQTAAVLLERGDGRLLYKTEALVSVVKKGEPWSPKDPLPARWAGVSSGFFLAAARLEGGRFPSVSAQPAWHDPAAKGNEDLRDPHRDRPLMAAALGEWSLAPGESREAVFSCYLGPRQEQALAAADADLPLILDRGFIAAPLFLVLQTVHGLTGNWGWAIIALTLLVRLIIHPLNRMGQISMLSTGEKMKRLKPRMDELQKRHKGDSRKYMEEQAKLMREEGMTPFSPLVGCLPMLLQMPVLITLYQTLQSVVELRGSPFLFWIRDLAKPDTVMSGLPVMGNLNPLPIALIVVTVYQMWRAPKPADPQVAQQQKMMMFIMPVMFGFMFYSLPSGITLYWFTSTAYSIGEQAYIKRLMRARGILKD